MTLRERRKWQHVFIAHEEAGDRARERHLYEDAAEHYQGALDVEFIGQSERSRVSEKLAYALALGRNPDAARPLFDRALVAYIDDPSKASKAVEILLQLARQLWIDARTESALPLLAQAVQIAEASNDTHLCKLTNSRMSNYLIGLARYKEANIFLIAVGKIDDTDDIATRATYYTQKGIIAAIAGEREEAFEYFEQAVAAAKEDPDVFHVTNVWNAYAIWAAELGNIELAKACYERALLVARQYHILWRISDLCLEYSGLLALIGQYGLAHEYLLNALAYDTHAPITDTLLAEVGIPLALYMNDQATLEKCVRLATINLAFRSGEPSLIGIIASVFAEWHISCGHQNEAQRLLHRALEILLKGEREARVWVFPIAVARFGSLSDIPSARRLIESRAALPCADVARACLELFDAFVARRNDRNAAVSSHASEAINRFEALGWHGYADKARALLPAPAKTQIATSKEKPFADMLSVLTAREQQVAELVLKGLTNHVIADMLAIKERTVEAHMTAIMKHLGLRSRHQLAERFSSATSGLGSS